MAAPRLPDPQIDLLAMDFVSVGKFKQADLQQVTKDWVRDQKHIFLNGVPLSEIVDHLKIENLEKKLKEFRDKGEGVLIDRVNALKNLYINLQKQLEHYVAEKMNSVDPDVVATRNHYQTILQASLRHVDQMNFQDDAVLQQAMPLMLAGLRMNEVLYDIEKIPGLESPVKDQLSKVLKSAGKFFTAEYPQSQAILVKIWEKHLLKDIPDNKDKAAYLESLSQYAHQGGVLFATLASHYDYLTFKDVGMIDPPFIIRPLNSIDARRMDLSVRNNILLIKETTKIQSIIDTVEGGQTRNADNTPVVSTSAEYAISAQGKEAAELKIKSAVDTIHNEQALQIIMSAFEKYKAQLLGYAHHYLLHGHNQEKITEIFETIPRINLLVPVKQIPEWQMALNPEHHTVQQDGDRILLLIGNAFPRYAESILENIGSFSKDEFVQAIKLLRRMGRSDLAVQAILPHVFEGTDASMNMETARLRAESIVNHEPEIRKVYKDLHYQAFQTKDTDQLLLNYLEGYLKAGHDKHQLKQILELFPGIIQMTPIKERSLLRKTLLPSDSIHENGDKVLLFINQKFPDYAQSLLERIPTFNKSMFVNAIKMLRRMGQAEIAMAIIKPQLGMEDSEGKMSAAELNASAAAIIKNESKIEKMYDAMLANKLLSSMHADQAPAGSMVPFKKSF